MRSLQLPPAAPVHVRLTRGVWESLKLREQTARMKHRGGGPPRPPRGWMVVLGIACAGAAVGTVLVLTTNNSPHTQSAAGPGAQTYAEAAAPVPTNRVTGSGTAMVQLRGDTATVSLRTTGLLNGSPHLMHIHAGGLGGCPPASAARIHNGHRAISTGDGIRFYGPAMTSLTEYGSTSGATPTNYDLDLYAASGNIRYSRTIVVKPLLASLIRRGNAVILVHGIDYDRNHKYDFAALGVSDLDEELPAEATAPALCGTLRASHQRIAGRESGRSSTTSVASVDQRTVPATAGRVSALSLLCQVTSARATARMHAVRMRFRVSPRALGRLRNQ
jgi:hypothetical protein